MQKFTAYSISRSVQQKGAVISPWSIKDDEIAEGYQSRPLFLAGPSAPDPDFAKAFNAFYATYKKQMVKVGQKPA